MKLNNWFLMDATNDDGGDGDGGAPAAAAPAAPAAPTSKAAPVAPAVPIAKTDEPVKAIWPEDWRKQLAGEDEKVLKQLGRYASPSDVWKKAQSLEQRLSSGELKSVLPKDAKPEEVTQWRKDNGIPEAPDKYNIKYDNNLVIGDEDKPMVDEFLKSAHASNMSEAQAKASIQTYYDIQGKQAEARAAKDDEQRVSTLDALNAEYGNGYRTNINMVNGVLQQFPADVQEAIKSARLPDGTALFNNPDVIRGFVAMALQINPAGTLVPNTTDPAKGVDEQIAAIEKTMKENRPAYNKDEKMQANYRELLSAREKLKERKAA